MKALLILNIYFIYFTLNNSSNILTENEILQANLQDEFNSDTMYNNFYPSDPNFKVEVKAKTYSKMLNAYNPTPYTAEKVERISRFVFKKPSQNENINNKKPKSEVETLKVIQNDNISELFNQPNVNTQPMVHTSITKGFLTID